MVYYKWMDELRAIATLAVVLLHVSSYFISNNSLGSDEWWSGNIYESITRFSVPIFFMLSGALAINGAKEQPKIFLAKKTKRILLPLIVWSIFFSVINVFKNIYLGKEIIPTELLLSLLVGDAYYHLWFLYTLFILCLLSPLLQTLYKKSPSKCFHLSVCAILAFSIIEIFLAVEGTEIQQAHPFILPFFFLPYYIIGSGLARIKLKHIVMNILPIIILFLALLIMLIARFFSLSLAYSYLSLPVALFASSVFLFYSNKKKSCSNQIFKILSPYYFGVYLLHPFFIEITYFLGGLGFPLGKNAFSPMIYIPVISIFVFLFSVFGTFLLSKSRRFKVAVGL